VTAALLAKLVGAKGTLAAKIEMTLDAELDPTEFVAVT
jgi:hypothetical protein